MVEANAKAYLAEGGSSTANKPPKPPNPVWRMMGLPNFRLKLPSRNWAIFLTITGSWTAAVMYDRRQKKHIERKWAKLVEHVASETIYEHQLNRRLTIYLSAPPADGLVTARDHFNEYVKPILVAAALDWDAVEGRREGDIRAGLAERIRRLRKLSGEESAEPFVEDSDFLLTEMRKRSGVTGWNGIEGDIVIGRHAWKEYVRGLHEGWLGPLDPPPSTPEEPLDAQTGSPADEGTLAATASVEDSSPTTTPREHSGEKPTDDEVEVIPKQEEKPKKKKQPRPFNCTADYPTSTLSPNCPNALGPTAVIPLPHLLGFFNFPIRMYRFLNRRKIADDVGRETAAAVMAVYRPFEAVRNSDAAGGLQGEQQLLLAHEESDWHKTVQERKDGQDTERVWLDKIVLDARIAERMKRFELDAESEQRASRVAEEKGESWWQKVWPTRGQKKNMWEGLEDID